jgi:molybdopterin synthase sulfur carrier subunit
MRTVTVQFYGPLRERAGCDALSLATAAPSVEALWEELRGAHALPPRRDLALAVAVDDELAAWDVPPGAVVAFLPPVAGG